MLPSDSPSHNEHHKPGARRSTDSSDSITEFGEMVPFPDDYDPLINPPPRYAIQSTQRDQSTQSSQRRQNSQRIQTNTLPGKSEPSEPSEPSVLHTSEGGSSESVRRLVFRFCRRLKGTRQYPQDQTLADFFKGNEKALNGLPWDDFRLLVMEGLDRVKTPLGAGPLGEALAEADSRPFPPSATRYVTPEIKRAVALCAVLQEHAVQQPFYLAINALAEEFDVDAATASRWLRLLVRDGVLSLVKKGNRGRATEYRYNPAEPDPPATTVDHPGPYKERF